MSAETAPPAVPAPPERRCQNCGEVLLGEHCYACGQPTKGLVRHFSSIIGDFLDSVFEFDSRILRTIGPLLFKPGYLTLEYFAGRRVRYVSPVRLFVFLSIVAFFAAQLRFDIGENDGFIVNGPEGPKTEEVQGLQRATTVAEVERLRDEAIAQITEARKDVEGVPGAGVAMDVAVKGIEAEARRRIEEIRRAEAEGRPVDVPPPVEDATVQFNDRPWDPVLNPVEIDWLGKAGNHWLNGQVGKAKENIARMQTDPNLLKDAFLSTVPTTLFVLLPLFALLLKVMYLFKRRLYMEHLIVALNSHAFLCGMLLLVLGVDALAEWTAGIAWLATPLGWIEFLLVAWMPLYLLLMQKRVYRQGWIMTMLKYWILGTCYLVLVSLGATASLLVSLVNM